jgi:hypothetical protein
MKPAARFFRSWTFRGLDNGPITDAQSQNWLFPANSVSGHLAEHKEDRATLATSGNDLRQTYRTVGQPWGKWLLLMPCSFDDGSGGKRAVWAAAK